MADVFDQPSTDVANAGAPAADPAPASDAAPSDKPISDSDFATLLAEGSGIKISEGEPAKAAEPAPVAEPAPTPDAAAPAPVAKKPDDPKKFTGELEGLDEPPAGLKQAASERYRKLVGAIHSRDAKLEKAEQALAKLSAIEASAKDATERLGNWQKYVSETGASEQELATTFTYLSDLHSNDPTRMRRAFDMLQSELSGLSRILGIKPTGVDPLGAYKDLRTRVDNNEIDEDTAMEIARLRANQDRTSQIATEAAARSSAEAAQNAQMETAQRAVAATLETFRKADPLYDSKVTQLEQAGTLAAIGREFPPSAWGKAIELAYKAVPGVAPPPRQTQPLRTNATAAPGTARAAPKSLEDALEQSIAASL